MLLLIATGSLMASSQSQPMTVASPDGRLSINLKITDRIYYNLVADGEEVMWFSPLSLLTRENGRLGLSPAVLKSSVQTNKSEIKTAWGIRSTVADHYNELTIDFSGGYGLIFRCYNDGVAYRWKTALKGTLTILDEEVEYRFLENHRVYAHVVGDFQTSYEKLYSRMRISDMKEAEFSSLPFMIDNSRLKLLVTEADLFEYPGMYITRKGNHNRQYLNGIFPAYPKAIEQGGWGSFNQKVTQREDYIALTTGTRNFPWRVIIVAREDRELLSSDMVYKLSRPAAIDASWVKPGRVSWEWWNDWNLEGVDFETGINNRTYEYYIDFAARNGIEYVIMDEGWSDQFDVLLPSPHVDMEHLTQYAKGKGVKLILWAVWFVLDRQMKEAFELFERWGIAGVKVDFIDRDDQVAVEFYERMASEAARHKLMVDFHGCSKPTGLHRTYPNVINFEAVRGNEYNKFNKDQTPGHNVDITFTRMAVGPMDYTPGAMRNSVEGEFLMSNRNPMSYGTRCHQLGMFVVYYAPLQMLCDAPTAYEQHPGILSFLSDVPVTWDETVPLDGKMGEYAIIARRKGDDWYIGGLTNWTERMVEIDLSQFASGNYTATLLTDGINANRNASDYQITERRVNSGEKITVVMKKGGGFAVKLKKNSF